MTYYAAKTRSLRTATLPDLGVVEYIVYPPRISLGETQTHGSADFYKWRMRISVVIRPDGSLRYHRRESTEGRYCGPITKADRDAMRSLVAKGPSYDDDSSDPGPT